MDDMRIDTGKLRALRTQRAWSQEHLAAVSGLSARTIQRLEADGTASHESRLALAAAFGIDPSDLAETTCEPVDGLAAAMAAGSGGRLDLSDRSLRRAVAGVLVMAAAFFIYQGGHSLGEFWYYLTH